MTEVAEVEPAGERKVVGLETRRPAARIEAQDDAAAAQEQAAGQEAEDRSAEPLPRDPAPGGKAARGRNASARPAEDPGAPQPPVVRVRRLHRRDLNRTWEFLKLVFRSVNRETVEYQRPRSKRRFLEVYEEEGEQLLFEVGKQIVGYAECAFDASGADNWINPRYFDKRGMRPLYVDELAVHPDHQGNGVGGFMLDQLQHLARVRGCTHLVLEVAENNKGALTWYRRRNFHKLDAAIFLAQKVPAEPELLPPRRLPQRRTAKGKTAAAKRAAASPPAKGSRRSPRSSAARTRRK